MISDTIITAAIGLVSGIAGSMFAPWAKWQFEKKRERYNNRIKFLKEARDVAFSCQNSQPGVFITTECYARVRPYLPKNIIKKWEVKRDFNNSYPEILDSLSELEKKWHIL
jgi:hypothetical protein